MSDESGIKPMGQVIQIDEARIRDHLGEMVRGTVEETLNAMLDAEADQLCCSPTLHRGNGMVRKTLHEHAAALPAAGHANRSRRLIKCAKDSGHYRP